MRRPALLGAAWLTAAAAAVGLGFLAVSFVGASAASTASFVAASSSATTTPAEGAAGTSQPAPPVSTGRQRTAGGTVVAHCSGGVAALAGAPNPGWWTDDSNSPGTVEFTNGVLKVEVRAGCPNGTPAFVVEGPTATGKGGGSASVSSTVSSPTSSRVVVSPSPTTDDKGGLRSGGGGSSGGGGGGGGGHGADG